MDENVIDLAKRIKSRNALEPMTATTEETRRFNVNATTETLYAAAAVGGGYIAASKLYGGEGIGNIDRFFDIALEVVGRLEECDSGIKDREYFSADNAFMLCRPLFEEMFSFNDISDAVSLISLKALLACSCLAINEAPTLPSVLGRIITRLRHAPFMTFEEASELVDEIETAGGKHLPLPGYNAIVDELLEKGQ